LLGSPQRSERFGSHYHFTGLLGRWA